MRPEISIDLSFPEHQKLFGIYKSKFEKLLHSTVPSKGKEFPKIVGPKDDDKVCIVGAGPAGLHMALGLKDKGYQKVKIFEKTNRHGGKSLDVIIDGVYRTLGTTYLTSDYADNLLKLAKRYNASEIKPVENPGVCNLNTFKVCY